MARKKSNAGLWWIAGIIVVIAMVPREVWIGLGVLGAIAIAAYVVIKWQAGSKAASKAGPTDQPTLAELMSSQTPSRGRTQQPPPRPTANPGRSAPPAQPAAPPLSKPALPVDRAITPPPAPNPRPWEVGSSPPRCTARGGSRTEEAQLGFDQPVGPQNPPYDQKLQQNRTNKASGPLHKGQSTPPEGHWEALRGNATKRSYPT